MKRRTLLKSLLGLFGLGAAKAVAPTTASTVALMTDVPRYNWHDLTLDAHGVLYFSRVSDPNDWSLDEKRASALKRIADAEDQWLWGEDQPTHGLPYWISHNEVTKPPA